MNLDKSFEFFRPDMCDSKIHIIGCGSVGSTVAELLARFGLEDFVLYDFDYVEPHNIVNQMFTAKHIGMPKTEALKQILQDINPDIDPQIEDEGWNGQKLAGYVFLAVDSIELRKKIVQENMYNTNIKGFFDFRTGLTDAQHYAADWSQMMHRKAFIGSMNFTDEEAKAQNPVSACNVELCVAPTVRLVSTVGVTNFINFLKKEKLYISIPVEAFKFQIDAIG